jgi:hypothetical protein
MDLGLLQRQVAEMIGVDVTTAQLGGGAVCGGAAAVGGDRELSHEAGVLAGAAYPPNLFESPFTAALPHPRYAICTTGNCPFPDTGCRSPQP